jgi:hypothetical protein
LQCASGEPALDRTLTSTFDGWLPKSLSSQIPNESARSLISSIGYDLSFLPTSLVHGNGVSDLQLSDPFGLARPSRLQVDDGVVGCGPGCSDYDSGLITYDGRGEMCGRGDVSTVVVPQLEAVMEAPCAAGIVRDPFGVPTGRSSIVDCDDSPKDIYYDVLDRAVVVHDMSAKTEVLVGSEYQYLSDPSKWTWTTKLFDAFEPGRVLRSVESSSSGVWKSTHDRFETLGRLVGEETRKSGVSTPVVRHVHHSAVRDTDQNGLPFVE